MGSLRGRVFFLPAIFLTQVVYLLSVWWVAPYLRQRGTAVPFVIMLSMIYAILFLVTYALLRLAYWERLSHADDGRGVSMFGISLQSLFRRTGSVYVDFVGLVVSCLLTVAFVATPALQVLVLLPGLCTLAFLGGILVGKSGPWEIRRRGTP